MWLIKEAAKDIVGFVVVVGGMLLLYRGFCNMVGIG